MSQRQVTWGQLKRFCARRGFAIRPSGGDKIIICPKGWQGGNQRPTVLIGHKCSSQNGDRIFDCYLSKLRRTFGISRDDVLNA